MEIKSANQIYISIAIVIASVLIYFFLQASSAAPPLQEQDRAHTTPTSFRRKIVVMARNAFMNTAPQPVVRTTMDWWGRYTAFALRRASGDREFRATQITDRIFLGDVKDAHHLEGLKKANIGHIVTIIQGVYPSFPDEFEYKHVNALDVEWEDLSQFFDEVVAYFHKVHSSDSKKNILVHCMRGASRSATVLIAYLMKHENYTLQSALSLLQGKRSIVNPNARFYNLLERYEQQLLKQGTTLTDKSPAASTPSD
eukprot:GFYU01000509.1.p1 GENE.GFYU01000509.1~~GFYU01000509.1.p1  ORF type:complete len:255 (-),score=53.71 GFYU01000509.1:147-911(-)